MLMFVETPHGPTPYFSSSPNYLWCADYVTESERTSTRIKRKIILEGNEDSPGEGENEDMTVDAHEKEMGVPE